MNLELFPPYQQHSDPSFDAAAAIKPSSTTLREKVFAYIAAQGTHGATDDEIQVGLDMNPSTQRPRRIELLAAQRIIRAGFTRKTRAGRSAAVWLAG